MEKIGDGIKMTFLKWYSFVILSISFIGNIFKSGEESDLSRLLGTILIILPIIIYIFLS